MNAASAEPGNAGCNAPPPLPPDVQRIAAAWPHLPDAIRAGVLALVNAADPAPASPVRSSG